MQYDDYNQNLESLPDSPTPLPQAAHYMMEEEIDIIEEEDVERIEVPRFDECRRSVVIHDFRMVRSEMNFCLPTSQKSSLPRTLFWPFLGASLLFAFLKDVYCYFTLKWRRYPFKIA